MFFFSSQNHSSPQTSCNWKWYLLKVVCSPCQCKFRVRVMVIRVRFSFSFIRGIVLLVSLFVLLLTSPLSSSLLLLLLSYLSFSICLSSRERDKTKTRRNHVVEIRIPADGSFYGPGRTHEKKLAVNKSQHMHLMVLEHSCCGCGDRAVAFCLPWCCSDSVLTITKTTIVT